MHSCVRILGRLPSRFKPWALFYLISERGNICGQTGSHVQVLWWWWGGGACGCTTIEVCVHVPKGLNRIFQNHNNYIPVVLMKWWLKCLLAARPQSFTEPRFHHKGLSSDDRTAKRHEGLVQTLQQTMTQPNYNLL